MMIDVPSRIGRIARRLGAGALALVLLSGPVSPPAFAQGLPVGGAFTGLLGRASDSALDKLAQPGAFNNDSSIRIKLPGIAGKARGLMGVTDALGVTNGLTKSLNDAAGLAARAAKPVFRSAISKISLADVPGLVMKNDGGTQYLRQSADGDLRSQVRPLIVDALGKTGAFAQFDKLAAGSGALGALGGLSLNRDTLTNSVTDQALEGIYKYMASEEAKLRANPLGKARGLLDVLQPR